MIVNIVTELFSLDPDCLIVGIDSCISKDRVFQSVVRERIENVLTQHYQGQTIIFKSHDGANIDRSGFLQWVETLQKEFEIPGHKIVFNTIIPPDNSTVTGDILQAQYPWQKVGLKAFTDAGRDIDLSRINTDLSAAKFVGALAAGRWSFWRLRMIYELDQAFAGDTYITHNKNTSLFFLDKAVELVNEIQWLKTKNFEVDPNIDPDNVYAINYRKAYEYYHGIWNLFHIEVVLETDEYQNQWFTDKVGKCLASGKPFVLLAGTESLKNLRKLGFNTFNQYIDESYDQCRSPGQRILQIVSSLHDLYNNPDKTKILQDMQKIAASNVEIYKHYVQSQI